MNVLPYRQTRGESKKRQLNSSGNKNIIIKRLKVAYEKGILSMPNKILILIEIYLFCLELLDQSSSVTRFHDLPNEIYLEIFDYLPSLDIINSFHGLNYRLNGITQNIPMKLNFTQLNKTQYKYTLKSIVPKLVEQTRSIELGRSSKLTSFVSSLNSEYFIDLYFQSFNLTQFTNLRYLTLYSSPYDQLEKLLLILPQMSLLCSLRLLENYSSMSNEPVCKVMLANNSRYSVNKTNNGKHILIDTSPPFRILHLIQRNLTNKMFFDSIQINVHCNLFFHQDILSRINWDGPSNLVSDMTYLKVNIQFGSYVQLFNLIRYFPKIHHLSVKTTSEAYANGSQWSELLAQMPNINKLDFKINLDSYESDQELKTFQTKFWLEQQWIVQCVKNALILRNIKLYI